jgi:hypothetical protein
MTNHGILAGDFFTDKQWRGPMAPFVDELFKHPGGVLLIAVELRPTNPELPQDDVRRFQ